MASPQRPRFQQLTNTCPVSSPTTITVKHYVDNFVPLDGAATTTPPASAHVLEKDRIAEVESRCAEQVARAHAEAAQYAESLRSETDELAQQLMQVEEATLEAAYRSEQCHARAIREMEELHEERAELLRCQMLEERGIRLMLANELDEKKSRQMHQATAVGPSLSPPMPEEGESRPTLDTESDPLNPEKQRSAIIYEAVRTVMGGCDAGRGVPLDVVASALRGSASRGELEAVLEDRSQTVHLEDWLVVLAMKKQEKGTVFLGELLEEIERQIETAAASSIPAGGERLPASPSEEASPDAREQQQSSTFGSWTNHVLPYMDSIPKIEHTFGSWTTPNGRLDRFSPSVEGPALHSLSFQDEHAVKATERTPPTETHPWSLLGVGHGGHGGQGGRGGSGALSPELLTRISPQQLNKPGPAPSTPRRGESELRGDSCYSGLEKQQQMAAGWTQSAPEHSADDDDYFNIIDMVAWTLGYGVGSIQGFSSAVSQCECSRDARRSIAQQEATDGEFIEDEVPDASHRPSAAVAVEEEACPARPDPTSICGSVDGLLA